MPCTPNSNRGLFCSPVFPTLPLCPPQRFFPQFHHWLPRLSIFGRGDCRPNVHAPSICATNVLTTKPIMRLPPGTDRQIRLCRFHHNGRRHEERGRLPPATLFATVLPSSDRVESKIGQFIVEQIAACHQPRAKRVFNRSRHRHDVAVFIHNHQNGWWTAALPPYLRIFLCRTCLPE